MRDAIIFTSLISQKTRSDSRQTIINTWTRNLYGYQCQY